MSGTPIGSCTVDLVGQAQFLRLGATLDMGIYKADLLPSIGRVKVGAHSIPWVGSE